jgi:hypothetical protein
MNKQKVFNVMLVRESTGSVLSVSQEADDADEAALIALFYLGKSWKVETIQLSRN